GVVERAGAQVAGFSRRAHSLPVERAADERACRRLDFERRGRDAAEHDARLPHRPVVFEVEARGDAKHWEVERAATAQLFINRAPPFGGRELNLGQQLVGPLAKVVYAVVVVEAARLDQTV